MSWIVSVIVAGLMTISLSETSSINTAPSQPPQMRAEKVRGKNEALPMPAAPQQDRIDQTYPLNANGRVSLNNINGTVVIEAWDKPEARVEAVKNVDCDKPYQIDINIDSNPSSLQIETDFQKENYGKGWNNGNRCREARVDYKLTLPRTARLDEVETVNGNITLGGMTDFIKASTVNGRINASNLRGTINLSSVNGTLEADFESLENVREIKIGMVNGKIDLQLPSDIEATLKADTVNGSINNDFGLPVRKGEYVGRNLYGRLGNGSITVRLDGVNGTINIRRKQDGRSPKQVTNLLPAKGKDFDNKDSDKDDDEDDDDEGTAAVIVRTPKPPKPVRVPRVGVIAPEAVLPPGEIIDEQTREEIRKSVTEATKVTAHIKIDQKELNRQIQEGLAEARREMAKARREMADARAFSWNADSSFAPMNERETKTVPVEGTPKVTIDAHGGRVSIRGWERAEVSYAIARRAANRNEPAQATVNFEKKGSDVTITVPKDAANYRLEINVPRNCNLRVTSNEQIRVEGVKGKLNLDGGEESVDVRDAGGNLSVRTDNGRVRVIGFEGATEVKTLSGDIGLEGNFSSLNTDSADGTTSLTVSDETSAEIESSTKDICFDDLNISISPVKDAVKNVWRIGGKDAGAKKYNLKTNDGKIFVRSLSSVRVTRNNQIQFDQDDEIYS
ncbi:MAG: DUF4097 family beta strand repeat-containing protein [Pyrinomonadaceae bacterium]